MQKKKLEEKFFKIIMQTTVLFLIFILLSIFATIVIKGMPYLSWEMITSSPQGGFYLGKEGGILNAILGSLYLALGSTILAFIISYPIAIYINIYLKQNSRFAYIIRFVLDILWSMPSIVFGVFGFTIMMYFGVKTSLLNGILIVSFLIIPIIIKIIDESIKTIPKGLYYSSFSLGLTKFEFAKYIISKQTLPAIFTALLIAFGRAIGDTATVMFTAGYSDRIPSSLNNSVATLPLAIFYQLGSPFEEVRGRAYSSALILIILILAISILSRYILNKYNKNKI